MTPALQVSRRPARRDFGSRTLGQPRTAACKGWGFDGLQPGGIGGRYKILDVSEVIGTRKIVLTAKY